VPCVRALVLLGFAAGVGWLSTACVWPPDLPARPNPGHFRDAHGSRTSSPPPAARLAQRDDDLNFCVAQTNRYRARHGKPPLRRSAELEAYAATGARYDTAARRPHSHFDDTRGSNLAFAENECPSFQGWSLEFGGGSVRGALTKCLRAFYAEGPGGGHYENMMGEYRTLGCGVYVVGGGVSIVQDFGR
jgi:Cysteine-rich secretory protein family